MIQCPYCSSRLGTKGSYRVHKYRYHRSASTGAATSSTDNSVIPPHYPANANAAGSYAYQLGAAPAQQEYTSGYASAIQGNATSDNVIPVQLPQPVQYARPTNGWDILGICIVLGGMLGMAYYVSKH